MTQNIPKIKFDEVKIEKLGKQERLLLLRALDFDVDKLYCFSCGEKVSYEDCCILPPIMRLEKARITCISPLCVAIYVEDFEKEEKRR